MGTGYNKRKKQAKMMQEEFMKMQEKMKDLEVTGSAGNGLVTVTLNGDSEVIKVKINPECVDPEDVEGLEDLFKAACNDAQEKLKKESPTDLSSMMGNMPGGLPGMPGMPGLGGF